MTAYTPPQAGESLTECGEPSAVCTGDLNYTAAGDITLPSLVFQGSATDSTSEVTVSGAIMLPSLVFAGSVLVGNLDTQKLASDFDFLIAGQVSDPVLSPAAMASLFAGLYVLYSEKGTVPGADLAAGGDPNALDAAFLADNSAVTPERMSDAISSYWATLDTPGIPAHGGTSVVSVEVNINRAQLTSAIRGVITTVPALPEGTLNLHQAIQTVLKSTPWTIVEVVSGSQQSFTEFIN